MNIEMHVGSIRLSVSFYNVIGLDEDYFLPRFEKELSEDRIVEWCFMGTAFDSYVVLEYYNIKELLNDLEDDLDVMKNVLIRNKKRLMMRSDENERKIMNVTCTIGGLCDEWINKGKS